MTARYPILSVRRGVAGYSGAVDTFDPTAEPAVQVAGPPWQSTGYVAGGAAQAISLLGPFTVAFDTPGITNEGDGALVTALDAGSLLLAVGVIVTTGFNGSSPGLTVFLGGSSYAAPDDNYSAVTPLIRVFSVSDGVGYKIGANSVYDTTPTVALWSASFGLLTTAGALVVLLDDNDATAGEVDIYALIATPA